ncbi:PP2C family protein-serine/threonine phosphatase [Frigidibacter sp. MR17.24]|uniref:PP2C family protein-serine/threonine phosphatase n=1 Tax=Frigidibacter sp. MR17.24 TaxID=3127345 RepID=UPI003012B35C
MIDESLRLEGAGASDRGLVRGQNEDRFLLHPAAGLWVVADGMGGHEAGAFAAGAIVDALAAMGRPRSAAGQRARFLDRLGRAHAEIQCRSEVLGGATIGATVAAVLMHGRQLACVWAGDSRVYRLRAGQLAQMTTDHSEVQELVTAGALTREQALRWPRRNMLTRAVGVGTRPMTETLLDRVEPGDRYLLCTDGLTEEVAEARIAALVGRATPAEACRRLVDAALAAGGGDNVTVVVLRVTAGPGARPPEGAAA